jgi:hypothetical protein
MVSLSGIWTFIIVLFELFMLGTIIFLGIDMVIVAEANFKKLAKYVVGAALTLYLLFAIGAAFGISTGVQAVAISPVAFLMLGAGIIGLFLLVYLLNLLIDWAPIIPAGPEGNPQGGMKGTLKMILGAIAIIIMLYIAADVLSGGSFMAGHNFLRR